MKPKTLTTERLKLVPIEMSDAVSAAKHANNKVISENTLAIPHPYTEESAKEWIESINWETDYVWAIKESGKNEMIGAIGLHSIKPEFKAELGYWLGEEFWGSGYMTEAARSVVEYARTEMNLIRLDTGVFTHNEGSRRVLQKVGFENEGLRKKFQKRFDGTIMDEEIYGLVFR